jgi:hypothetical protein
MQIEIGNYDSFYDTGIEFSSEKILKLTKETREMLPDITLSVTVPHTLSLLDQVYHLSSLQQYSEMVNNQLFNLETFMHNYR